MLKYKIVISCNKCDFGSNRINIVEVPESFGEYDGSQPDRPCPECGGEMIASVTRLENENERTTSINDIRQQYS